MVYAVGKKNPKQTLINLSDNFIKLIDCLVF